MVRVVLAVQRLRCLTKPRACGGRSGLPPASACTVSNQHAEWGVSPWNRQEALRVAIAGMGLKAAQRKVSTVTHVTFGANTLG